MGKIFKTIDGFFLNIAKAIKELLGVLTEIIDLAIPWLLTLGGVGYIMMAVAFLIAGKFTWADLGYIFLAVAVIWVGFKGLIIAEEKRKSEINKK